MLELSHIHKYYNPGTVNEMCLFKDFNFEVKEGEFVSVVGSNGSGKTSMLNIICGSIPVDSGSILVNGKDITRQKEYKRIADHWPGISGSCQRHLSQYDYSGKYGHGRK